MIRTSSIHSEAGDPFAAILRPPDGETDYDRQLRLKREAEAKRISDSIDDELRKDEKRYKKRKEDVKLLLLGQAESGKSTLQKQFQLMYSPNSLEEERLSWRSVIYYNIARPVRRIFEVIDTYGDGDSDDDSTAEEHQEHKGPPSESSLSGDQVSSSDKQLASLRLRLSPLLSAESSLSDRLSGGTPVSGGTSKGNLFVRSGWQARALLKSKFRDRSSFTGQRSSLENAMPRKSEDSGMVIGEKDQLIEEVANILYACQDDIKELWDHTTVRSLRETRKLRLEEWAELWVIYVLLIGIFVITSKLIVCVRLVDKTDVLLSKLANGVNVKK
ncbi:hypothetical protein PHLCEN_2v7181 [Hermanssonia centrifuga]|uniref:Uncharacterized protein n=1 Tax=Hermanssonia centrifuga TaxID=98765 RepID=A0A2R6NX44_9APHY|nr:hypothetical protein PHLCEN_2v7181 [Hermanssonia centrifuga]